MCEAAKASCLDLMGRAWLFYAYKRDGGPHQKKCAPRTLRAYRTHLELFIRHVVYTTRRESVLQFNSELVTHSAESSKTQADLA